MTLSRSVSLIIIVAAALWMGHVFPLFIANRAARVTWKASSPLPHVCCPGGSPSPVRVSCTRAPGEPEPGPPRRTAGALEPAGG